MIEIDIDDEDLTDEQKDKLKGAHELFAGRIQLWRAQNGVQPLPLYWVEHMKEWQWADRETRKRMEKIKKNNTRRRRRS